MLIKRGLAIVMVATGIFAMEVAMSVIMKGDLSFPSSAAAPGQFPEQWIHGSKSAMDNTDPAVQVHRYNDTAKQPYDDTAIRQSSDEEIQQYSDTAIPRKSDTAM